MLNVFYYQKIKKRRHPQNKKLSVKNFYKPIKSFLKLSSFEIFAELKNTISQLGQDFIKKEILEKVITLINLASNEQSMKISFCHMVMSIKQKINKLMIQ